MINWTYVAAAIIGVLSAARLTRLVVNDAFPPSVWLRNKWDKLTKDDNDEDGKWTVLVYCPWCAGPYLSAIVLAWALLSNLHWTWWVFNGWLAGSYAASWIAFHDED